MERKSFGSRYGFAEHENMSCLLLQSGESIYYRLIDGTRERPCLVFLHEGLGCVDMWKDFPDRLCAATGCPGLLYDRQGHGRSSPLEAPRTIHYLHDHALRELPQVLAGIMPGRPFIMVGHSDGGTIALIFAAEKPDHLAAIITEAAHVFIEPVTLEGIRDTVAMYEGGRLEGLSRYHGDKTEALFRAWCDTWLSPWFAGWNIEYLLPSVDCPLLVIQGADDQYATEGQVRSIVSRSAGVSKPVMVERCGHSPHGERPDEVLDIMATYIKDLQQVPL